MKQSIKINKLDLQEQNELVQVFQNDKQEKEEPAQQEEIIEEHHEVKNQEIGQEIHQPEKPLVEEPQEIITHHTSTKYQEEAVYQKDTEKVQIQAEKRNTEPEDQTKREYSQVADQQTYQTSYQEEFATKNQDHQEKTLKSANNQEELSKPTLVEHETASRTESIPEIVSSQPDIPESTIQPENQESHSKPIAEPTQSEPEADEPKEETKSELIMDEELLRSFNKSKLVKSKDGLFDHSVESNKEYYRLLDKIIDLNEKQLLNFRADPARELLCDALEEKIKLYCQELISIYDIKAIQFKSGLPDTRYGHTAKFLKLIKRAGFDQEKVLAKVKSIIYPNPNPKPIQTNLSQPPKPQQSQTTSQPTQPPTLNLNQPPKPLQPTQPPQPTFNNNQSLIPQNRTSTPTPYQPPSNLTIQKSTSFSPDIPSKSKINIESLISFGSDLKGKQASEPKKEEKKEIVPDVNLFKVEELDIFSQKKEVKPSPTDEIDKVFKHSKSMMPSTNLLSSDLELFEGLGGQKLESPVPRQNDPFEIFGQKSLPSQEIQQRKFISPALIENAQRINKEKLENLFSVESDQDEKASGDEEEHPNDEDHEVEIAGKDELNTSGNKFPFAMQPDDPQMIKLKTQIKKFNKLKLDFRDDGSLDMSKSGNKEFMKLVDKTKEDPKLYIMKARQELSDMLRYFDMSNLKLKGDGSLDLKSKINKDFIKLCDTFGESPYLTLEKYKQSKGQN